MKKKITIVFILLLVIDSAYSFYEFYHTPIGGDLAEIVNPTEEKGYYHVLQNPFALGDKNYPNPNRYFAHITTKTYFKYVPLFLQNFVQPITSVYLTVAISKILIQLFLIYLLSSITFSLNLKKHSFWLIAVCFIPFFQTFGYNRYMGIIDQSAVYNFFYALPVALCLLFLKRLFAKELKSEKYKLSKLELGFYLLFLVFICLNGPLVPAILLIVGLLYTINHSFEMVNFFKEGKLKEYFLNNIQFDQLLLIVFACLLSLYSLWAGSFNELNKASVSLLDRYAVLPEGIWRLISRKLGYPLLLGLLIFNLIIGNKERNFKSLYKWIFLFCVLYTFLLPLGGYREYRPNIIKYDTILPVTIALIFILINSSITTYKILTGSNQKIYGMLMIFTFIIFSIADLPKTNSWKCEYNLLSELHASKDQLVILENTCPLMEWNVFTRPDQSELNSKLFYWWNITDVEKRYIQQ